MHSKDGREPEVVNLKPNIRFRSGKNPRLKEALFDDRILVVLEVADGEEGQVHVAVEDPLMGQLREGWFEKGVLLDGARNLVTGDVLGPTVGVGG